MIHKPPNFLIPWLAVTIIEYFIAKNNYYNLNKLNDVVQLSKCNL
jgi:purine-cytosine permease-like protein